ncbi:DsbA family protein, partial [Vibrio sp. OPT46]|nr:DsbA family protein [Vibrio sp. OPT46]
MDIKLYYVHDPMCSWCWGYKPTLDKLKQQLP